MKVKLLGINGPFPSAGGACSSYLIESENTRILVDAGSGSLSNLMKFMDPAELDAIFLSHLHWDHITDIPVLNYYLYISGLQGQNVPAIPLYLPETPKGVFDILSTFKTFDINILNEESCINIGNLIVTARQMTHPVESYALKFSGEGKSLVYSGDTTFNQKLPVFAKSCDLLIADSAFLESGLKKTSPHMCAAQCALTASEAGAGRLLLTHLNPGINANDYVFEAAAIFSETSAAELLKEIEV